jgi:hypothetical protein
MRSRFSRRNRLLSDGLRVGGLPSTEFVVLGEERPLVVAERAADAPSRVAPFWINVPNPALTSEFVYRHNYGFAARLLHIYFRFVTSAVVGNRVPAVVVRDSSGNRVAVHYSGQNQAAGVTREWQFSRNWSRNVDAVFGFSPAVSIAECWLPEVSIMPNWTVGSEIGAWAGMAAGDQVSGVRLLMIKERMY